MFRRRYVAAAGAAASTLLAGCVSEFGGSSDDDTDEADSETDTDEREDSAAVAVVEAFLDPDEHGDVDPMREYFHSANPLHPEALEEEELGIEEVEPGVIEDVDDFEIEAVSEDASIEAILELEDAEFWFTDTDLEAEVGDEERQLFDVEADRTSGRLALATEDDEWKILFMSGFDEEPPEDPEEVFDDEIIDEDGEYVVDVEYSLAEEHIRDDVDYPDPDQPAATVEVAESADEGVDEIRVESTIEDQSARTDNGSGITSFTIWLHEEGDQVVVTVVEDGEERIVHREHYLP